MSESSYRLSDVADVVRGRVLRHASFSNLGFSIHEGRDLLSWAEGKKFLPPILKNKGISAVIASPDVASLLPAHIGVLIHDHPRRAFFDLHNHLARSTTFYGRHGQTDIHSSARIHPAAHVAETGVRIGEDVVVEAGVQLMPGVKVGVRTVIRAGAVIGSQGFQFYERDGRRVGVEHVGGVDIGSDVEIQANTHIARAIFGGDTIIRPDAKIDALVHVAHNVCVGARTRICAGTVIGGSVVIGEDVYIGPGATITNCIRIGHGARVTLGSVVVRSVQAGQHVTGHWAVPHDVYLRGLGRISMPDTSSGDK